MRGDRYNPWRVASSYGVRVIFRDLPGAMWGAWHAPSRVVVLDRGLSQRERRCTLAHELVHVEAGDSCHQPARVEQLVHRVAAARLITLPDLAEAMRWSRDPHELAEGLWVDDRTLSVRLDALTVEERERLERLAA